MAYMSAEVVETLVLVFQMPLERVLFGIANKNEILEFGVVREYTQCLGLGKEKILKAAQKEINQRTGKMCLNNQKIHYHRIKFYFKGYMDS